MYCRLIPLDFLEHLSRWLRIACILLSWFPSLFSFSGADHFGFRGGGWKQTYDEHESQYPLLYFLSFPSYYAFSFRFFLLFLVSAFRSVWFECGLACKSWLTRDASSAVSSALLSRERNIHTLAERRCERGVCCCCFSSVDIQRSYPEPMAHCIIAENALLMQTWSRASALS